MTKLFPDLQPNGMPLPSAQPCSETRSFLAQRRSTSKRTIVEPGPSPEQLDEILKIAARVPDHRKLEPWRFIVFEGEARSAFGAKLADVLGAQSSEIDPMALQEEHERLLRAPVVVAVVSSPVEDPKQTPIWEQELSCGALCYNLLLAARACGFAGSWLSEWIMFDEEVNTLLGLTAPERIAGFIYLGTSTAEPPERPRPDMSVKVTRWSA